MSVVIHKDGDYRNNLGNRCSFCDTKLRPPFVVWDCMPSSEADLLICGPCCRKIKNGLMADLVQVAAIAELHDLGYRGMTLDRRSHREVSEELATMFGVRSKGKTPTEQNT